MRRKKGKPLLSAIMLSHLTATFLAVSVSAYFLVSYGLNLFAANEHNKSRLVADLIASEIERCCQEQGDNLDPDHLNQCILSLHQGIDKNFNILVTNAQGVTLTSVLSTMDAPEQRVPGFEYVKNGTLNITPALAAVFNSQPTLMAYSEVAFSGWYVILYDDRPAYHQVTVLLISALLFIFVIYLLFTLLGGTLRQRRISRSIDRLIWQTKQLSEGHHAQPLGSQPYRELTQLAESFDQLNLQLQERNAMLENLAYTDSLTSLANRSQLMQYLFDRIQQAPDEAFAVIYMDLDDFKRINDSFGHPFGDKLLIEISHRLTTLNPTFQLISRIGGDEFVLIVSPLKPEKPLQERLSQLFDSLLEPYLCDNKPVRTAFSMGIALYPQDGENAFELLKCSDIALYAAKNAGKSTWRFFDHQMRVDLDRQMYLEEAIASVVEHDELQLNYQVQLFTDTMTIRGFEALIRWNSPKLGYVSALELIGVAEGNGQIIQIGQWILRQSCLMIMRINQAFNQRLIICVNVSPVELRHPDYVKNLKAVLAETGLDPHLLELEITEQVMIDSGYLVIDVLNDIKDLGVGLALDDFGTGFSSLAYLQNLPVQTIKIDQSFVADLQEDCRNWKMLESIMHLAQKLQLFSIAEGIENESQMKLLASLDCSCLQGYYVCRPLPEQQLVRVLEAQLKKQIQ